MGVRRVKGLRWMVVKIFVALLPIVLILPVSADNLVHVSSCMTLDKPGYYILDSDLIVNKTKCIEIKSSDITLDGENHKVTAGFFGGTYAIFVYHQAGLKNVTIRNLSLENWVYGVFLRDVERASVYDVDTKDGFFGIYFSNVKDLSLKSCKVSNVKKTAFGLEKVYNAELRNLETKNATENGLLISDSESISIHDSVFEYSGFGIYVKNSNGVTISKCKSAFNEKFGLYIYGSDNITVSKFGALQNDLDGIKIYSSKDCMIYESNFDGNRNGIFFEGTKNSKIIDNTILNSKNGIIVSNSKDNHLTSNEILNVEKGVFSVSSSYNLINSNRIAGVKEIAILFKDSSSNTITDNWIHDAKEGIVLRGESQRNLIYLNNLFAERNAYDDGKKNTWYSPELKKGNYYSDYKGSDAYGDGIGDQDYVIPPNGVKDIYPLMNPTMMTPTVEKKGIVKEEEGKEKEALKEEVKENTPLPSMGEKAEESIADFNSFELVFGIGALIVIATLVVLLKRDGIL